MIDFPQEVVLPQKTIFKKGSAARIAKECLEFGMSGLIVCGQSLEKNGNLEKILKPFPPSVNPETFCRTGGEPTLDEISDAIKKARQVDASWIAGIGGGSVIDLAKAAAGLYYADKPPAYYQEGGTLEKKGIAFIAVPTTAGTGSEATINSVIINSKKKAKLSIRDKSFLAETVILDAELLKGIPKEPLAYAAMDAYVQAYESFISKNATWFSERFALKAIELVNSHVEAAFKNSGEDDLSALLLGSYFSGIAFNASRLGVIHGIAHPLGALYHLPHGLICAACFIPSIKINRVTITNKYDMMTTVVGMDFLKRIEKLLAVLNIHSPFKAKELIEKEKIITATLASGSTAASPKKIDRDDVEFILKELFGATIV